jgi:predicted N-acetyltransferase YhbS
MSGIVQIDRLEPGFLQWDVLLDLIRRSFASMNGIIDPPSSALHLTADSLREKSLQETAFLAHEAGQIVGCIFCKLESPYSLYVGKLAVLPEKQGRGIGRALLSEAEGLAVQSGCTTLRLETRIELLGNHRFFRSCGFEIRALKSHAGYSRPTFLDMQKRL